MVDNWLPMPRYKLRKDLVKSILRRETLEGKTCLELGYGAGDMLLMYAELGLTTFGFDISEEAYDLASRRISAHFPMHAKIELLQREKDIQSRQYDFIMAFEVLEHIEDDASMLKKWHNLLRDSGKLIISVPAHANKWGANDTASGHYRRYERSGMSELLRDAGFRVSCFWNYAYPLSILLDFFLNRRSDSRSMNDISMIERSKVSGIRRKKSLTNRMLSSDLFLSPFFLTQRLFLNRDFSSAFLIAAEKPNGNGRSCA